MKFLRSPSDIKLGDYGHFTDDEDFYCEGNLFAELESLSSKPNITSTQHKISEMGKHQREGGVVRAYNYCPVIFTELYKPLGLSLPSNDDLKSLLASFSTRLTNRYLITRVIQCTHNPRRPGPGTTRLYNIAKPFVWHRNEGAGPGVSRAARWNAG
ncbi:hypothetical protein SCLCIDRAFT_1219603 [Scleroderma citrinum Foug A]|uniref:Uncharacterized protein n=1 Tax=Scleroderma citrinum Foug A TaxID=1036808 RepID=A0A0C3DMK6_9AGAM|nr:hypothetical protein SCLCIDRAFT_1219603 [Scleroderma citrinum Foug A]